MKNSKNLIRTLINDYPQASDIYKRNLIKEYLQVLVLHFVYSHKKYSQLVFYGGTCLHFCFGLERLSEDLDFVDLTKKIKLSEFGKDLKDFFARETDLDLSLKAQKFRIYLKFPILKDLGLADASDSNFLLVKVEVFSQFNFCQKFETEITPFFKFNRSVLIKNFDLPTLFATKIRAVLYRQWKKTAKDGKLLAKVKGRDYFDLFWYLQKGIKPNITCLGEFNDIRKLRKALLQKIAEIDPKSLQIDLENLVEDKEFVLKLSSSMKNVLKKEIQSKLKT